MHDVTEAREAAHRGLAGGREAGPEEVPVGSLR